VFVTPSTRKTLFNLEKPQPEATEAKLTYHTTFFRTNTAPGLCNLFANPVAPYVRKWRVYAVQILHPWPFFYFSEDFYDF